MGSHDDYKFLWRDNQNYANIKPWSGISESGFSINKRLICENQKEA